MRGTPANLVMPGWPGVIGRPGRRWTPTKLGASLLGWWDADHTDLITLVSGNVSSWKDRVAAYDLTQGTSGARPAYSATSFNNKPGVTFDGIDDFLTLAGTPFPTGANACEMWALLSQAALPADTGARSAFSYGGNAAATRRSLNRVVNTGANRATATAGSGGVSQTAENSADFSSRHVLRAPIGATGFTISVDGVASAETVSVPATGTTVTRIGANTANTAANFHSGVIAAILVTGALSAGQAASLHAYLNARK